MREKAEMLETRFACRRQAEKEKRELMESVENLKKQGKFNKQGLAKLGLIEIDEKAELPVNSSIVITGEKDAQELNNEIN